MARIKTVIKGYFKKKFWKIYLSDMAWIALITSFLIYTRWKVSSYLALINSYSVDFNAIQAELANETASGVYKLQLLMAEISPIVDRLNLFVFFTVPVIVFLVWVIFITISFAILRRKRIIHLLPAFAIVTVPFYLIFIYLANILLGLINQSLFGDWKLYLIMFVILSLAYLLVSAYSFVSIKGFKESILEWLKAIRKGPDASYLFFLFHAIAFSILFFSMLNIAIKYVTGSIGSTFWSFIVALLSILAFGLARSLFHSSITK